MERALLCVHCLGVNATEPQLTFLGNPSFKCGACGNLVLHPMSRARAITYLVFLGIGMIGAVLGWLDGRMTFPGIGILVIYALGRDVRLRRELQAAEARFALLRERNDPPQT
jgi:hypothetical protein